MIRSLFVSCFAVVIVTSIAILACPDAGFPVQDGTSAASILPQSVREYIASRYFPGVDPGDPAIEASVEVLILPKSILDSIETVEWEKNQVARFAQNKLFMLLQCPDGKTRAIAFRDGEARNDRELTDSRVRVLRRLYSPDSFNAPPAPELCSWMVRSDIVPEREFAAALAIANAGSRDALDDDTVNRARTNLLAEKSRSINLAIALGALTECGYQRDACRAAIWLISRMDKMSFQRENKTDSVCDLETVDARAFYENVYYAVRARNEFPWAADVSESDFFNFVLSQRATGEPLQRWRRHFFDALYLEVAGLTKDDLNTAMAVAQNAYGDYFQYEGDTTWEDFGLLTSLAVHEGRCEDCSNVLNAMYWTIGIPACQAYTPYWGHADGNHAWTWVRGMGDPPGDGHGAVKVYVKTWDGTQDVTTFYTPVAKIEVETQSVSTDPAELKVWNLGEWRTVAKSPVADGKVLFDNVGCSRSFALLIAIPGDSDRVADVHPDGSVGWFDGSTTPDPATAFPVAFPQIEGLGTVAAGTEYEVVRWTATGWESQPTCKTESGDDGFMANPGCLYRITGEGVSDRPFTVEEYSATNQPVTTIR